MSDGQIILGSNQENVAFPSGMCAERVALYYAGANFPDLEVLTLCIVAKGPFTSKDKILSPCEVVDKLFYNPKQGKKTTCVLFWLVKMTILWFYIRQRI